MKIKNVNLDIAITHIITRKRQTIVAALGVMLGIAIYLFMNSLSEGFSAYSTGEIFKNNAHLKIYKEDKISEPLIGSTSQENLPILINPQIISDSKTLVNPKKIVLDLKKHDFITHAIEQVNVDLFYKNGKSQLRGTGQGVNIVETDSMFNVKGYMIAGNLYEIQNNIEAIIIGKGIAEKLNLKLNDNLTITSSIGVNKILKVKGIFSTGNSYSDQSKSYINIHTAQQLLKEGNSYVTTIYANTKNAKKAVEYAAFIQPNTNYKVEAWQITNADVLSGDKVRATLMGSISFSILIVAAFGIYNILNMTVVQKMNDIAILKATGYSGRDVIQIFLTEAILMGLIGSIVGLLFGSVLIAIMSNIYMGPPVGYFPIYFNLDLFINSFILGLVITFFAGYIPARKAAKIDPIAIFRK